MLGVRALFASSLPQSFGRPEALTELVPYEAYYSTVSILILALAGIITPELLCPDRRDRVLDLYYSTAVSPREYLTAKFGSALGVLLLTTLAPVLFLFAGNILFAVHPLGYFQDHWTDLPRIVAAGFVIASYYAALGLAVSSLTSRRAFAMGGAIALLVASGTISAILAGLGADDEGAPARAAGDPGDPLAADVPGRPGRAADLVVGVAGRVPGRGRRLARGAAAPLPAVGRVTDAIVVDGVARWFRDRVAVADVSFRAGPGVTGLLGHNGAGKTTMLRLLAGFTSPSRGTVRILGADPRREPEVFRARRPGAGRRRAVAVPDGAPGGGAAGAAARRRRLRRGRPPGARHRRARRGRRPPPGGVLEGHAAGREARAGARARPGRAAARRAPERPRSGPPARVRGARPAARRRAARP